ncbi:hypothetical protein [Prosthecobacter fluviatilis]|uniref:Uncharacterized protein n=1 Tax=Prosthecobacter fluviatilis TaxID=445931 RepID=A0ABW0KU66_9BACT
MHARWQIRMLILAGFVSSCPCRAQEPGVQVTLKVTAVKESDWQHEMAAGTTPDGLRERLHARTLAELTGEVKEEGTTVMLSGEKRDIVTRWEFDRIKDQSLANKTAQELIGTEVRLQQEPPKNQTDATRISLSLIHDLSPPQSQSFSYANAAEGAEREKHSVTAPRFERLRWQGEVLVGVKERMIANFVPANDASTRIVVFFKGSAGSPLASSLEMQQTIYRIPELEMIEWLLQSRPDDTALAAHLQKAVTAGRASIVSSTALSVAPHASTELQTGTEWRLPSEVDQVLDRLYLVPIAFGKALEGTRLKVNATGDFHSFCAPRAPLAVRWPTSWLRARDEQGNGTRALHGWMDWYDRFEQEIVGVPLSASASPQLVAMMQPADQVWGADRKGRWLDVTLAQLSGDVPKPVEKPATPTPADPFASPPNPFTTGWSANSPTMRSLFLGIALDTSTAHALLQSRQPQQDEALLRDLLARVKRGEGRVITSAFSTHNSNRYAQSSARLHARPTEMPSIPSAWEDVPVGTRLEQDGQILAFIQDLAPPARTEWKLTRDVPEAIMWQPRFRKFSLTSTTAAVTTPGTHLLAAVQIPAVMTSADFPAQETIFLFSHLDSSAAATEDKPHDVEIETLTFEIPAQDAAAWQAVKSPDIATFTQERMKSGHAKLQSQTLLRMQPGPNAALSVVEEYRTATEFDPPSRQAPYRMRPTALQMIPVGLQLEAHLTEKANGTVILGFKLQHSTARPKEPGLEETLQIFASGKDDYPGAKHAFEEWIETLDALPGQYHCLGILPARDGGMNTTSIIFVRARAVK